jgi:DNA-directed DNA polymerase III PolC
VIKFDTNPFTGSTVNSFIERAAEVGQKTVIANDITYFLSFYRAYLLGKQKGVVVLPSVSIFVNTPTISSITVLANTQEAFSRLSSLMANYKSDSKFSYHGQIYPVYFLDDVLSWVKKEDGLFLILSTEPRSLVSLYPQKVFGNEDVMFLLQNGKAFVFLIAQTIKDAAKSFTSIEFEDGHKIVLPSHYRAATESVKNIFLGALTEEKALPKKILYVTPTVGKNISLSKHGSVKSVRNHIIFIPIFSDNKCYQTEVNKAVMLECSNSSIPTYIWYNAFYSTPKDKVVQDVRLSSENKHLSFSAHIRSKHDLLEYCIESLGFGYDDAEKMVNTTIDLINRLGEGFSLSYQTSLVNSGTKEDIKAYVNGLIKKYDRLPKDPVRAKIYLDRLRYELEVLSKNGEIDLLPYFIPIVKVLDYYYEKGQLTGPGRGSAAGSLLLYLIGITHVDPIKYGLSFERFLSLARIKKKDMPDVDTDLSDRTLLVGDEEGKVRGFLWETYGDRAAQISTRTLLRLKSSIKDVNRYFNGRVMPEIEELTKKLPSAPQGVSDTDFVFGYEDSDGNRVDGLLQTSAELKAYTEKYAQEWEIVKKMLGVSRQYSKHASAFVISNTPISKTVPVFLDGKVTQYEAKEVEKAGLIKYDFLVVNQLKDIQLCLEKIAQKHKNKMTAGRFIDIDGSVRFVWDLPEKEEVFKSVWDGNTTSLFQINTDTMKHYVIKMKPQSIEDLAVLLALVRPGPMDYVDPKTNRTMADEYLVRRFDIESTRNNIIRPLLDLLPETYGVMVYQEQNTKVAKDIGKMSAEDAEELRRAFAKKQLKKALEMKPLFMKGATETVGADLAQIIWEQMETSARYSFNKSHAVSYAFITYATMYLRYYYPLEWWASVLENADEHEFSTKLYPHIKEIVAPPTINATTSGIFIDYKNNKIRMRLSLLKSIGEKAVEKLVSNAPYKNLFDFAARSNVGFSMARKLLIAGVMDELFDSEVETKMREIFGDSFVGINSYQSKVKALLLSYLLRKKTKILKEMVMLSEEDLAMDDLSLFLNKKKIYPTAAGNFFDLVKNRIKKAGGSGPTFAKILGLPVHSYSYHKAVLEELKHNKWQSKDDNRLTVSYIYEGALNEDEPVDRKYLVPGFVIEHKWFRYKGKDGKQKTALKIQMDFGSNIQEEVVLWPPYGGDTAESILSPNKEGKKKIDNGSIVVLLYEINKDRAYLNLVQPI